MSKATKIWLIIAISLILVGGIIFTGVMMLFNWDFTQLSTSKFETNKHDISENVKSISIITDTADIVFVKSEDSSCSVTCFEHKNSKHRVEVNDGTMVIEQVDTRKWYEYIGINFGTPKITVSLPKAEYGKLLIKASTGDTTLPGDFTFDSIDISKSTGKVINSASASEFIKIKTSTGDIRVENVSAGEVDLSVSTGLVTVSNLNLKGDLKVKVSTGRTNLTDVECESFISTGSTGNVHLKNVVATQKFSIERSTGDIKFDGVDASEIFVETDTGDVRGSLLSEKVFIVKTDTGDVSVPKTVTGGRCEITTDTGDIKIEIK